MDHLLFFTQSLPLVEERLDVMLVEPLIPSWDLTVGQGVERVQRVARMVLVTKV